VALAHQVAEVIREVVPFTRVCWHTVDPGTVLFTGGLNVNIGCSGTWLAEHEYVIDDVNKWWFLARSGRLAGATSTATHGDLSRSARHRTQEAFGIGDELRGSFVADGAYWGAVGFLRERGDPLFTGQDERFLASLSAPLAHGFRRSVLSTVVDGVPSEIVTDAPGVVVFDGGGSPESISPGAQRWIAEMMEEPAPASPAESRTVQAIATRARLLGRGDDPLGLAARARVRTRTGTWLLLYGTPLSGGEDGRVAVIVQPAPITEVAPLVALAYGLSERERQVTRLCMSGMSTKQMARRLDVSPYTVQDHLKAIFRKTGARTRGELVGQVFLEHYVPRWEPTADPTPAIGTGTTWSASIPLKSDGLQV
jgi:DNA-binding CsgD family transcriptional regulator